MLLVTLALKTLLSISQNGISPIALHKQLGNHLNKDIINASNNLVACPAYTCNLSQNCRLMTVFLFFCFCFFGLEISSLGSLVA